MIGTRLRFFSEYVFGAWVDGTIVSVGVKNVTIKAYFQGNEWREKKLKTTTFYYPDGHEKQGEPFQL